jgi:hypothetical protein
MDYYAGIDVSLELSSVCILDGSGQIVREARVASEPEALATFLASLNCRSPGSAWRPVLCRSGCMRLCRCRL